MKLLSGTEITTDMPKFSTETAIEKPADGVQIIWRYFDMGCARSCHSKGGTLDLTGLGEIDDAVGVESFSFAEMP